MLVSVQYVTSISVVISKDRVIGVPNLLPQDLNAGSHGLFVHLLPVYGPELCLAIRGFGFTQGRASCGAFLWWHLFPHPARPPTRALHASGAHYARLVGMGTARSCCMCLCRRVCMFVWVWVWRWRWVWVWVEGCNMCMSTLVTLACVDVPGAVRIDTDLNKGAGGTSNYLWVSRDPCLGPPVRSLRVFVTSHALRDGVVEGFTIFPRDLNKGTAKRGKFVYLGYHAPPI